jgi:hypothetical protein
VLFQLTPSPPGPPKKSFLCDFSCLESCLYIFLASCDFFDTLVDAASIYTPKGFCRPRKRYKEARRLFSHHPSTTTHSLNMAPAALHDAQAVKSENSKAVKVLEELLSKLTVSKAQDEINSSAASIATFINGDIEEADAPTKYVQYQYTSL